MQAFVCIWERLHGYGCRFVPMCLCMFVLISTCVCVCTCVLDCGHVCNTDNLDIPVVPYQH